MATPREHIEEIRKKKFKIGEEPDPKNEDLHHAVNYLSAELYTKDVHFLMELIQNAEDNEYLEGVKPSLEFVITSRDVTATGASATLLLFNNEKGFSAKNIESICSVGRSTKKGNRKSGYIGEKGIGFKSVFLIASRPYVFSNGYQIRFNEEPCPHCKVGYIVPEWVDDNPTLSNIKQVYGSGTSLPTTIIVLPLKPDKVHPVKQQLSSIHPELLLFLSKIKRLSVKEDNKDPKLNSVTAISISSETDFATRKNIDAESFLLHLSANEKGDKLERECCYHMWRQRFPVKQENKVERRMDVEELVITLAFPNGKRLNRGMQTPGIYAFLPTEMVTNFPFIIQADFVLASSRETILLDNQWNRGILDYVPSAFINGFIALVKTVEDAPVSCLPPMFEFLPINSSPYPELNVVRETIQAKLLDENIIPCESYTEQKLFHKPSEVWRLMPAFWGILNKAKKEEGVRLHNICSHGRYVLSSSFDSKDYDHILNFLGVKLVEDEWYVNCLWVTNLVLGVSEEVYLDILLFLAEKWRTNFQRTNIRNIPLLKYVNLNGEVSLYTLNDIIQRNVATVLLSCEPHQMSWLIDWNKEFRCQGGRCFLPKSTQEAIQQCSKRQTLLEWLSKELKVDAVNVYQYAAVLAKSKFNDLKLVITYIHFLYHSLTKNHLSGREVKHLCGNMPLVDNYGRVLTQWKGVLVPANGSKWFSLMQSNPWRNQGFVELGEDYLRSGTFAGVYTPEKQLISFLKSHIGASDVPNVSPPDVVIPTMCLPLTKQNTFLLLYWIRNRMRKGVQLPRKFLTCVKEGSWMKISLSGSHGYRPPSQSFLPTSSWGQLLQNDSVLVDIPIIDRSYYGDEIDGYKEELGAIGVMFEYGEACQFVGKHLMSLVASSTLTRGNVLSILQFIKFLKDKFLSAEEFISSIRLGKWLKTSLGYRSPFGSVLYDDKWRAASQISDIPFIDQDFYGEEILCFKTELQMLGVVISFGQTYQLVSDHLKSPADINARTAESGLYVLQCLQLLKSSDKFVRAFKDTKFLKTNKGYMSPVGSYLLNAAWGCLLQVFNCFPSIDQNFYGNSIFLYKNELKQLGVVVDFEDAAKAFARVFRQKSALSSISKDNVLSLLACYKKLQGSTFELPKDLRSCIRDVKWVRTRLGDYRVPRECILFGPDWESLSPISALPFIDDTDNCYGKGIHEFKEELKNIGVVFALKDGFRLVAAGLSLPPDPSTITPANVQSLLECVRNFQQQKHEPLPDSFLKKIGKEWLRTYYGYRTPGKCLLFDSHWNYVLRRDDGPFIDEEFYGSKITSYAKELSAIGVTVEVRNGCRLLARHLNFLSKFNSIVRIYSYLRKFNWKPDSEDARKIWIPNGGDEGEWVNPGECVLYDEENLFSKQLKVLEKHYEINLLNFFSNVLGVKPRPSLDDYCLLWKQWERSGKVLSPRKCCAFWKFVAKNWSPRTQETLVENLLKLPVYSASGEILLQKRRDVYIADDLQLKDLFEQWPIFVWFPQPSLPSLPRSKLLEVYSKIGARNISECVRKEKTSVMVGVVLNEGNPRENLIGKELIMLILGFLAGPSLLMEAENRHEAVRCLLNVTVIEIPEPIKICYSLLLSCGEKVKAKARSLILWDRKTKKLWMQKMDSSGGQRSVIEYATYFSEAIAGGLLWEKEDCIDQLAELIKLGFLLEFDESAIQFLMKTKNLQVFLEDYIFLYSTFP